MIGKAKATSNKINGLRIRSLISVVRDITERKRSEEELRQQREWLLISSGYSEAEVGCSRVSELAALSTSLIPQRRSRRR